MSKTKELSFAEPTAQNQGILIPFNLFLADLSAEHRQNKEYPVYFQQQPTIIRSVEALANAVHSAHLPVELKEGYRKDENFISSNVIILDLDNSHSENEEEWILPDLIQHQLQGIQFYCCPSRNHLKDKTDTAGAIHKARPKYHLYFPIRNTITDPTEYKDRLQALSVLLDPLHLDCNAQKVSQMYCASAVAVEDNILFYDGDNDIIDYIEQHKDEIKKAEEQAKTSKPSADNRILNGIFPKTIIKHGNTNTDLHRRAVQIIKKSGGLTAQAWEKIRELNTNKYYETPLPEVELKTTVQSAEKYFNEHIINNSDYIPDYDEYKEKMQKDKPRRQTLTEDLVNEILEELHYQIAYDEICCTNKITENGQTVNNYGGQSQTDRLATMIIDYCANHNISANSEKLLRFLQKIADDNSFNEWEEMFAGKEWDGEMRLPKLYDVLGIDGIDDESRYAQKGVEKWLTQALAIFDNKSRYIKGEDLVAADIVLVLEGRQGIGKTLLFRKLAIKPKFFQEGHKIDTNNKDTILTAISHPFCELGELDATFKKEQADLKGFITRPVDRIRRPYGRDDIDKPRTTVFCGTVNDSRFLKDQDGGRRWYTIHVDHIDINFLLNCSDEWFIQLWLEIKELYYKNPNYDWHLKPEDIKNVCEHNNQFLEECDGENEILTYLDFDSDPMTWTYKTAAEIVELLGLYPRFDAKKLGRALKALTRKDNRIKITNTHGKIRYLTPAKTLQK